MRGRLRTRLLALIWALISGAIVASAVVLGTRASGVLVALLAVVLGGALSLAITALLVRWVDESVRPLTQAARLMHGGDLNVRARVPRDRDVAELGATLDKLAGNLSQTVDELRAERDLVSRILNGMQEGVLLLDRDGKVAMMNAALREMLLLRADVVGQPLLEVVRHAELKELLDRAQRTRRTCSGEVELGGLKPRRLLVRGTSFKQLGEIDGSVASDPRVGTRASNRPAPDAVGGLLAVFFDVTDIRRLESLRRDFVANVSHELRTPVTAVLSAAETLELAMGKDPEGARRFLAIIERNATRLQRLIEDLLDLSRIESRELRLRSERFVFEPFAAHVLGMFRERADKKGVGLSLDADRAVEAEVDRRALEQILTNLVDNAVKYCHGGCTVTVRAEAVTSPTRGVRLVVEDDGMGIEEKHLPRLFERFYRVDAGRSREMGGTGLGLSIVKHLVEAMGGSIDVTSTVGEGTTFEVKLPDASARGKVNSSTDIERDSKEDAA